MSTRHIHDLARATLMAPAWVLVVATYSANSVWAGNRTCVQVFDFDCAHTDQLPVAVAAHLAEGLPVLSAESGVTVLGGHWSDRAIQVDLVGDKAVELLVPTECGATGNCTWYIYATDPQRQLGTIDGALICVERGASEPARLIGYSSAGAGQGRLVKQVFKNGRYKLKSVKDLDGSRNDSALTAIGSPSCIESVNAP